MIKWFACAAATFMSAAAALGDGCIPAPTSVNASDNDGCSPVQVEWNWEAGADFRVVRAPVSNPGAAVDVGNGFPPLYDYSAQPGELYYYRVIAIDACGESDPSAPDIGGTGLGTPPPPSWVFASDNQYCDLIVVEWDTTSGAGGYDVYRGESPDFNSATLVVSGIYPAYMDYAVSGNVGYYYWVVANDSCGQSGPSQPDIGYSNFGLYITGHPSDAYATENGSAGFGVGISGFGAFQWFKDGSPLYDDGRISGAQSSSLSIFPVYSFDEGNYYCEVYGGCGTQTSNSAHLYVFPEPCTPPNWVSGSSSLCDLIVVEWDTSQSAWSYDLYRGTTPDFGTAQVLANFTMPPFHDTGVQGNIEYYYWVSANLPCGITPPGGPGIGLAITGPNLTEEPSDVNGMEGDTVTFSIEASDYNGVRWYKDGQPMVEGGRIGGVNSTTLTITGITAADEGDYHAEVEGGCGTVTTGSARLFVEGLPCPADFNGDGGIDGGDVGAFFASWEAGDTSADVNFDGGIDGGDVETFFIAWEAGGCT
ncbi:MAG: immunoglobulin domain-containing protein [Phycisphaerae bacterium]|nr:immunoglobulin domain-containing protein [Phycisphaerae bacterium]